jgi:hypothetical protein
MKLPKQSANVNRIFSGNQYGATVSLFLSQALGSPPVRPEASSTAVGSIKPSSWWVNKDPCEACIDDCVASLGISPSLCRIAVCTKSCPTN